MQEPTVILPPPEIRTIADKTADFVARNGIGFEERIREKEMHNPKFGFLNPNDPYHSYYKSQISKSKQGNSKLLLNSYYQRDRSSTTGIET